ncbi:hypothetical protein [Ammoniphilus sp. CFH 90114]|uniref:hypothetical protein n=1 Tax=Ammoniphilus sp. CFH 90114 TaxID=2493665 RepID=UPI00100F323A|nr:hypothetical protein [Ammoniphilus sp. CFH 90114]RXT07048.1 hypothetical protein EIZ39_12900 [Ammoniphilus sp. CFH 90114]
MDSRVSMVPIPLRLPNTAGAGAQPEQEKSSDSLWTKLREAGYEREDRVRILVELEEDTLLEQTSKL